MSQIFNIAGAVLFLAAAVGLLLMFIQALMLWIHSRRKAPELQKSVGISILKPLCGVDEELWANLQNFAELDYPDYELLLGISETSDPAYPIALNAQSRWPNRVRVVLQEGEPGLNPKVNQLISLARAAKHGILVVSDSNVQVSANYLHELAAYLENPKVGLVNNPVVARGERSLVARMEALHLGATIGAGQVGAKILANKTLVVGKSVAIRRETLNAIGGFEAFKDLLAEDYFMGQAVLGLGLEVVIARNPIYNVFHHRSLSEFYRRYMRWSIMQRLAVGYWVHLSQTLLVPVFLATLGLLLSPSRGALLYVLGVALLKMAIDRYSLGKLSGEAVPPKTLAVLPLKDLILGWIFLSGMVRDTIVWRGNKRKVLWGTRLVLPEGEDPHDGGELGSRTELSGAELSSAELRATR